jgi:beta-hydroxyacyl-ACP dehydratase FabZ
LIDRIIEMTVGNNLVAIKNVTINEPFFRGHFPSQPIMPGVMILEAMAQAGSFLILNSIDDPMKKNLFFTSVDKTKFRVPVIPGDQLRIEMQLVKFKLGTAKLQGKAYVGDRVVCEAVIMANVVDRQGE